jgi:general secretion pathway protein L
MKILFAIAQGFSYWIESVAATVIALHGWLAPPRVIKLVEGDAGVFAVLVDQQVTPSTSTSERIRITDGTIIDADTLSAAMAENVSGSRIELVLRADRFLFAPLELPGRAAEFLDGVVRAQIDRLTPWSAAEAAFGWSKPTQAGTDRFITTIAATALGRITPFVQAIASLGAQSISVFTSAPEAGTEAAPIKVFEGGARGALDVGRIRQALKFIIIAAGIGAGAAVSAWEIAGVSLDAQQEELSHRIASARAATNSAREVPVGSITAAHRVLEQFKHESPSSVIVLDALSQILPDHTYVTELRIEDNKLRLSGVSMDAPSLISLIEQSGRFTRATFSAPTTQSPSEPGERFHIEADIQPLVPPRS